MTTTTQRPKTDVHTETSRQLFSRPEYEHCEDFGEMKERAAAVRAASREEVVPTAEITWTAMDRDGGGSEPVMHIGDNVVEMTNYAMMQIGSHAKIPMSLMQRVDAATLADALTQSWAHAVKNEEISEEMLLLHARRKGQDVLRSMTGPKYHRLWDEQIVEAIETWLLPAGWHPTLPTINQGFAKRTEGGDMKPALFLGDRSSHMFFTSPERNPDNGGMFTGLTVGNSEVGFRAFEHSSFLFMEMCANFLIWEPREVRQARYKHTPGGIDAGWKCFLAEMQDLTNAATPGLLEVLEASKGQLFTPEVTKLNKVIMARAETKGITQPDEVREWVRMDNAARKVAATTTLSLGQARRGVEAAFMPRNSQENDPYSVWGMVQGITDAAKDETYQDAMVDMVKAGSSLLGTVTMG